MAVSITKQARDRAVMETDTMTVALLREYGLPGARERARYHVGRCVEASLVDDAASWMRVTNYLENLASLDHAHAGPRTPSGPSVPYHPRSGLNS
ncbi:hypothetical protein S101446_03261 (plasmid) [Komagataeibacter europaeus]|nr:hypothetical protein S101446_03261 [Komagataeibacter europaeus]